MRKILLLSIILAVLTYQLNYASSQVEFRNITYTVHTGDTLWAIAEKYLDSPSQDIREKIYQIRSVNTSDKTKGGMVFAGTKLLVPVPMKLDEKNIKKIIKE